MIDLDRVHELYLKYRKDKRVIRAVANHPILFAKQKIVDEDDWRPIRIRYGFAFVPRTIPIYG